MLKVSEIFRSLQGEGPTSGAPAIFVRFAGCNLFCRYCDTPYTWNWQGTKFKHKDRVKFDRTEQVKSVTVEQVEKEIRRLVRRQPTHRLVLTGGEPMLQQKWLSTLIKDMYVDRMVTEIETNGTIGPLLGIDRWVGQYNVSPKLAGSGVPVNMRVRKKVLAWFAQSDKAYFKYVVTGNSDLREVVDQVKRFEIDPERVYLMPEGRTIEEVTRNSHMVQSFAKRTGFRFCTRLQILLYGSGRGV